MTAFLLHFRDINGFFQKKFRYFNDQDPDISRDELKKITQIESQSHQVSSKNQILFFS